jgi:molybdate transport system permease protein
MAVYGAAFSGPLANAAAVSARVVALSVALAIGLGLPLAVALARWKSRARTVVEALLLAPLVLPPTVTGYALALHLGRRGPQGASAITFTWPAAAVAAAVVAYPLFLRAARPAFAAVDPRYPALARTLGAGRVETFWRVTFPLAAPGVAAGAALCVGRALGEFGATLMVAGSIPGSTRTLPLALYAAFAAGDDPLSAGIALLLVALAVLILAGAALAEAEG